MTTASLTATGAPVHYTPSQGLWTLAWRRLLNDRVGLISMIIVLLFIVQMILSGTGMIAKDWSREVGVNYAPPTFVGAAAGPSPSTTSTVTATTETPTELSVADPIGEELAEIRKQLANKKPAEDSAVVDPLAEEIAEIKGKSTGASATEEQRRATLPFGADKWGRDVLAKVIKGSETSIFVGLAAALVATFLGTLFGAIAGFYGRWVDDVFNWFYSVFTSIPYLLLILAIAAVLNQKGIITIILILGLTGWTGIFRLVRAEYLKHKAREYVQAASAIGASNTRRMFVHILPNVSHVVLVQLSLHVVSFIKSEVILSFLGFGVPVDVVSWGSMLNEAPNELVLGYWWQLAAATLFMALLVTAFSLFTDALRDALDPKLK